MKMTFKLMMVLLVAGVFATSCGSSETETAQVGEAQQVAEMAGGTFTVDTAASVINWKGEKFNGDKHLGTLNLAAGELSVENGNITAGNFTIDMTSIEVTDEMPADKKGYLVTHLTGEAAGKEGDFFNTKKYPTVAF